MPPSFVRRRKRRTRFGKKLLFRRKRFARRVRSVILRSAEPKRMNIVTSDGITLADGDGISRVILVQNIPSNLVQGIERDQFIGDQVYLKGVAIHGQIVNDTANYQYGSFIVRWTLLFHRVNAAGMTGSGVLYGNTTTDAANPTQVPPFANPAFFDATSSIKFTGDGFVENFDTTNTKVIGVKQLTVNPGGSVRAVKHFKHFFPIRSKFQFIDPNETGLTSAPNHGKYGSYYLIRQVVSNCNTVVSTVIGDLDIRIQLYFKDI